MGGFDPKHLSVARAFSVDEATELRAIAVKLEERLASVARLLSEADQGRVSEAYIQTAMSDLNAAQTLAAQVTAKLDHGIAWILNHP